MDLITDLVAPRLGSNPWWLTPWARRVPGGRVAGRAAANQAWWFGANPIAGLPPSLRSAEAALRIERNFISHHVKAAPREFVPDRLDD